MSIFIFLILFLCTLQSSAGQDDCSPANCSPSGPTIKFPFRLIGRHSKNCGYPGFDLSCSPQNNQTILTLPDSIDFFVNKIDYRNNKIHIYPDPEKCFPLQLRNLNLSRSPFQFPFTSETYRLTYFDCGSRHPSEGVYLPCLSSPEKRVYSTANEVFYYSSIVLSCRKMYDVPYFDSVDANRSKNAELVWPEGICRRCETGMCVSCEEQGMFCRLKKNGGGNETECSGFIPRPPPKKVDTRKAKIIGGIVAGSFLLVLALLGLCYLARTMKQKREDETKIGKFLRDYEALNPARYSYSDIKKITHNFKDKVGQGSYGTVYKGQLSSDVYVAVKILNSTKTNGEDFVNEVEIISGIHHINVVRLVGYCADGFRRALIYEFLPNDSLEKFVSQDQHKLLMGWKKLQDIAMGIAKGIEYLHIGCDQRILHFDIKPHNILLDHNLNPKVSDFGQAKLCSKDQSIVSMTAARGTIGYIAPEMFSRNFGNVSYKSDVYSFGMLLLGMVGENRDLEESGKQVYFPEWVYNRLDRREDLGIHIKNVEDAKIAKKLAIVGLWCIQWYPVDRPSMNLVVQMLEEDVDNLILPANPFLSTKGSASGELDVIVESE